MSSDVSHFFVVGSLSIFSNGFVEAFDGSGSGFVGDAEILGEFVGFESSSFHLDSDFGCEFPGGLVGEIESFLCTGMEAGDEREEQDEKCMFHNENKCLRLVSGGAEEFVHLFCDEFVCRVEVYLFDVAV